jgi:hypothetical protein
MNEWPKTPDALAEEFAKIVPGAPGVQRKKMFGYPCAVLGGHMFMGLHGDRLVLKLPEAQRQQALAHEGVSQFEPMPGRPMKEFVALSADLVAEAATIDPWIRAALQYAADQPPKQPKAKRAAKK